MNVVIKISTNFYGDHKFIRTGMVSHGPHILNFKQLAPATSCAVVPGIALNWLMLLFLLSLPAFLQTPWDVTTQTVRA